VKRYPEVSVIMPTFNSAHYLRDAISSVLRQSFQDFELVVVDDGSTDETASVLNQIADPRLQVVSLDQNMGLASARNVGLEKSRGELIAWLDSDDLSRSDRLMRQVRILRKEPEIGLCGSWVKTFGGTRTHSWRYPRSADVIASRMVFDDPLATSSVVVRRVAVEEAGGFNRSLAPAEDYDLWERLTHKWHLVNVPRFLTRYRLHNAQSSVMQREKQCQAVRAIQARQLQRLTDHLDSEEWRIHLALGRGWGEGLSSEDLPLVEAWVRRLLSANETRKEYPVSAFRSVLLHRLHVARHVCQPSVVRHARRIVSSAWNEVRG